MCQGVRYPYHSCQSDRFAFPIRSRLPVLKQTLYTLLLPQNSNFNASCPRRGSRVCVTCANVPEDEESGFRNCV
jgi:hypothetical protein